MFSIRGDRKGREALWRHPFSECVLGIYRVPNTGSGT